MSEDLEQLKRDYEIITRAIAGVRDLYPYIVSQKYLLKKIFQNENIYLVIGCHWIVLVWFTR